MMSTPPSSCWRTGPTSPRQRSRACSTTGASTAASSSAPRTAALRGHPLLSRAVRGTTIPDEGLRGAEPRLVPCDDLGRPATSTDPRTCRTARRPACRAVRRRVTSRARSRATRPACRAARRHSFVRRQPDVRPERLLEAVAPSAVVAVAEVRLRLDVLGLGELAIEVPVQQLLALVAGMWLTRPPSRRRAPGAAACARGGAATSRCRSGRRGSAPHRRRRSRSMSTSTTTSRKSCGKRGEGVHDRVL